MPKISSDGTTITFKALPHYFKLVSDGRKWADLREVNGKWLTLLRQADYVQFETVGSLTTTDAFRIINISEVPSLCRHLYHDCTWHETSDVKLVLITFSGHVCVDFRGEGKNE